MARSPKWIVLTLLWLTAIGVGLHGLMVYKGKPGAVGETPAVWPKNSAIPAPADKPVVVMFAHPQCPCTQASIAELELLVAQARDKFHATVLFYQPESKDSAWTQTATTEAAATIPGVHVAFDKEGDIARQFGAQTSGQTVVYSAAGRLLFSGGITGSRGHMGENKGFDSVLKLLKSEPISASSSTTKVFGCGLLDQCQSPQTEQPN